MEKTFGKLLRELRRSRNISQRELANKVGVDFTYISKLENDRLPPPAADTIQKISETLEVPGDLLLLQSGKISSDITEVLSSNPDALKFMFEVKAMNLTNTEWQNLTNNLKNLR